MFATRSRLSLGLVLALALAMAPAVAAVDPPATVSPGSPIRVEEIDQRCPTFSWGAVPGARGYELMVFVSPRLSRLGNGMTVPTAEERLTLSPPNVRAIIPASATSWTPSMGQCFATGEVYVWYLRETNPYSAYVGEWSAGMVFGIADGSAVSSTLDDDAGVAAAGGIAGAATDAPGGNGKGNGNGAANGTGGIPAVLGEIAALQQQVADNQAELLRRLDAIEARMAANHAESLARFTAVDDAVADVDADLFTHAEAMMPCTPQRWREGKCDILEVEATVCFNVGLGAELGAAFSIEPGMQISLGGSWHEVPKVEFSGGVETQLAIVPPLPLPPIPIVFPDLTAGASVGADGGVEVCIANLTIPLDRKASTDGADTFIDHLVTALEAQSGTIADRLSEILDERGLDGSRIADNLTTLRNVRGGGLELSDPLHALREGPVGEFVDTLPIDGELRDLVNDPERMVPSFDGNNPLQICEDYSDADAPILGGNVEKICNFVDGMPDLVELADTVNNLPSAVADKLCDAIPFSECDSVVSRSSCRGDCRTSARSCKNSCGLFQFSCRRDCERRKDNCTSCCNNASDPGTCHF